MWQATRYEIKYHLSRRRADLVLRYVDRFMDPDPNGDRGSYAIHSLYLDGPDWSVYRDTRNGAFSRFKLRGRCYSFAPDAPVFFEVKSRTGESMSKTRVPVTREAARALLWGEPCPREWDRADLEQFRMLQDARHAFPRAWVTYGRDAFVAQDRLGLVRVTLDSHIACAEPTPDLSEPADWKPLPETRDRVILEIKYHGSYPGWVAEMVRRFELERKAMSKYRYSVDVLRRCGEGLLPAPRLAGAA